MTESLWFYTQWEHFWLEYFLAGLFAFYGLDIIWTFLRNIIKNASYGH